MSVEVAPATVEDVERLADQWVALAREMRDYDAYVLADENRARIRENLLRAAITGNVLVAREEDDEADDPDGSDEPLGFVQFSLGAGSYELGVVRGVVVNLFVRPDERDRGIGSTLLDAAEETLREAGADVVALEVMAANEDARRFYARHGYEPHRVELAKRVGEGPNSTDGENDSN